MIDAIDPDIQCLPDMRDRILLVHIAVYGAQKPLGAGTLKNASKFGRRVIALVGIEPHADNPLAPGQCLLQSLHGRIGTHIAQKAHDKRAFEAKGLARRILGTADAVDYHLKRHPAAGMRLGVKKDFRIAHLLAVRLGKVGISQIIKIDLFKQHPHALVVNGQKRRQIIKLISRAHLISRGIRQRQIITPGQRKFKLGLQRALKVHMQFALGHTFNKGVHRITHHLSRSCLSSFSALIWAPSLSTMLPCPCMPHQVIYANRQSSSSAVTGVRSRWCL